MLPFFFATPSPTPLPKKHSGWMSFNIFTVAGEARVVCVNGCDPLSNEGTKYPPVHDNI